MAAKILSELIGLTFSGMDEPKDHGYVAANILRASIWGTMGSGATALVSFIFSRYLIQNECWKSIAPHVIKATLSSCGTFAAAAAYLVYKFKTTEVYTENSSKTLNARVSLFAKSSAMVGLIGAAAAALATKYVQSNTQVSSVAKHSFYPLLGLGVAALAIRLFQIYLNRQLTRSKYRELD